MKIAAYMVVKNDAYFIGMAIKSVLPYVCGIYIQDQMSDDGTWEKIQEIGRGEKKIVGEQVDTGPGRFHDGYNEPFFRSMAVERCEEIFKPEWVLKLDADEIYTPFFFEQLEKADLKDYEAVRVAGDRFISKTRRSNHPSSMETSPEGVKFVDPHTQLWRAGLGIRYMQNPFFTRFHPILSPDPWPQYWLEGICNIHLHRIFGPKSLPFWRDEGGGNMVHPYHPPTQAKKWYESSVNLGNSEEVDFVWPDFVLEKWKDWGIW